MTTVVIRYYIILCQVFLVSSFACSTCSPVIRRLCCFFSSPNCCSNKAGVCPSPIPSVPATGLYATTCTGDENCGSNYKCCPIRQDSTGTIYRICTVPTAMANAALIAEGTTVNV